MKLSKNLLFVFLFFLTSCTLNNTETKNISSNSSTLPHEQKVFLTQEESQNFINKYDFKELSNERKIELKTTLAENIDIFKTLTPSEVINILGTVSMEKESGNSTAWYYYYNDCNIIIAWEKYIDSSQTIATITEYVVANGKVIKTSCLQNKVNEAINNIHAINSVAHN